MLEPLASGVFAVTATFDASPMEGDTTHNAVASPDWSDFNAHDPGLAALELLAWVAEPLAFRNSAGPDHPSPNVSLQARPRP